MGSTVLTNNRKQDMTDYLVTYTSKLFTGYRVICAQNPTAARQEVEAQGYNVAQVIVATYDQE